MSSKKKKHRKHSKHADAQPKLNLTSVQAEPVNVQPSNAASHPEGYYLSDQPGSTVVVSEPDGLANRMKAAAEQAHGGSPERDLSDQPKLTEATSEPTSLTSHPKPAEAKPDLEGSSAQLERTNAGNSPASIYRGHCPEDAAGEPVYQRTIDLLKQLSNQPRSAKVVQPKDANHSQLQRVADHRGRYAWDADKLTQSVKAKIESNVIAALGEPDGRAIGAFRFAMCQYFTWIPPLRHLWLWLDQAVYDLQSDRKYERFTDRERLRVLVTNTWAKTLAYLRII